MTSTMKNVTVNSISGNVASSLVPIPSTTGATGGSATAQPVRITIINSDSANALLWGIGTSAAGRTVPASGTDFVTLMLQPGDDVYFGKVGSTVNSAIAESVIV